MQDDYGAAAQHYQAALTLSTEIADRRGSANARLGLGDLALAQGDLPAARSNASEARSMAMSIEYTVGQLKANEILLAVARAEGNDAEATWLHQEIQDLRSRLRR